MTEICRIAATILIASTWEAIVLALVVAACLRLMPRLSAATRYAIWTAALAILILLPTFSFTHPKAESTAAPALHIDLRWSLVLAALWAALSLLRAAQLAVGALRLRAIAHRATPFPGQPVCTAAGTTRTAVLCLSDDVARPSVLGFFSPRILIPTWLYARLSPAELDHIILHEMQHLRRRDDWVNLLQKIGLILFPLNPALLWVERRLCLERELACDDSVLSLTHAPRAYARCLVNLAERHLGHSRLSLALGAWERRSELARRVHSILRLPGRSMKPAVANAVAAALILAIAGGGAALSRSPQLVSFVGAAPTSPLAAEADTQAIAGRFQAVHFHPSAAPHMTTLKATLPTPATKAKSRRHALQTVRQVQSAEPTSSTARMTLTGISMNTDSHTVYDTPQVIFTVVSASQVSHSYAAVPTSGGWLIIQL